MEEVNFEADSIEGGDVNNYIQCKILGIRSRNDK